MSNGTDDPRFDPDPNDLDNEWVNQPRMRRKYGEELADARLAVAEAKRESDLTAAELELEIRSKPEKFKLPKSTEAVISAAVKVQDDYQTALKTYNEAKHEADVLEAAVKGCDHRKSALEELVALHLSGYYSNPKAPEGAEETVEEWERKATRKGRKKSPKSKSKE